MNAAPVVPLSLLAESDAPTAATRTVRGRLRYVAELLAAAGLAYWTPAIGIAERELSLALVALDSIAGDAPAAPRSWLVERIESEV